MSEDIHQGNTSLLAPLDIKQLAAAGLVGVLVGLIVWSLGYMINTYVLQAFFCDQIVQCGETMPYALGIASVVGAGFGLFGLIKLRVLRPLLVVLTAMMGLWGLPELIAVLPWYGVGVVTALLYAGIYTLCTWVARLRSLWIVLGGFIIFIIALRLALTA